MGSVLKLGYKKKYAIDAAGQEPQAAVAGAHKGACCGKWKGLGKGDHGKVLWAFEHVGGEWKVMELQGS
jgi:hypothetical protein